MAADVEAIVIGGGVVGLAIARTLVAEGREVIVLERHGRTGSETSSRNSEVIHAGLYYTPGSLKARLCVEGKDALYRFCAENGVAAHRCGKLLVATAGDEIPKLEAIAATAWRNGVTDLVRLSADDVRTLEPEVACVAAYLSPSTGVIDSHAFMTALEGHVTGTGGQIVLNSPVTGIGRDAEGDFAVTVGTDTGATTISCRILVNAAGLEASHLGKMLNGAPRYTTPETYYAKGHYFALGMRAPFAHLVYPMPSAAGLGVHLTLDIAGRAKFGPDVTWTATPNYTFEDLDGLRLATFTHEVRRYWPALPDGALQPDYTGIRPKIVREGEPAGDFLIHGPREHGIARFVGLYGIESPGLTSSLAIADHVAHLLA
jgi:L-2-hydroxyglutarate oxidase LhgO